MGGSLAIQPQQLMNMEMMLYGNTGITNYNAPSMYNNYMGGSIYNNPAFTGSPYFGQSSIYDSYINSNNTASGSTQAGSNASATDIETLSKYCEEKQKAEEGESIMGAAIGGAAFAAIQNPRTIVHPINTIMATKNLWNNPLFKECTTKGTKLCKLWTNPQTNELIRDAYFQLHKAEARSMWKFGLFRGRYSAEELRKLKDIMESALKTGDPKTIAEATEKLKHVYNSNGYIPKGWNWVKNLFRDKKVSLPTATESIAELSNPEVSSKIATNAKNTMDAIKNASSATLGQALKKALTVKACAGWVAFDFIIDLFLTKNIQTAFSKDKETGWKQVLQTAGKGVASAIGWVGGEAIGTWACTKALAAAGTAIAPGVGTVIGAVAGFVAGSLGTWITGKIAKKFIGEDVAEGVRREQMKSSPEGHAQLLELTAQYAQKDKNVDPKVLQALQNVYSVYSSQTK